MALDVGLPPSKLKSKTSQLSGKAGAPPSLSPLPPATQTHTREKQPLSQCPWLGGEWVRNVSLACPQVGACLHRLSLPLPLLSGASPGNFSLSYRWNEEKAVCGLGLCWGIQGCHSG